MSDPRSKAVESYGSDIPYAEPSWYQQFHSPFYKPTHVAFRQKVRGFVDEHIAPL
jgi:hypothetical protein